MLFYTFTLLEYSYITTTFVIILKIVQDKPAKKEQLPFKFRLALPNDFNKCGVQR